MRKQAFSQFVYTGADPGFYFGVIYVIIKYYRIKIHIWSLS